MVKPQTTFGDTLKFSPYVFAKLIWMRDRGNTEVAGYGITETEDPLLVTDFKLIKQVCTVASFDFDPEDGAEFMEQMADTGLMPWQYSNLLLHSHPGNSPNPSTTDETNFVKSFSHPHWAIMFIIADGGDIYCRLKANVGPGIVRELKISVDWSVPFLGSDVEKWKEEYEAKVSKKTFRMTGKEGVASKSDTDFTVYDDPMWKDEHIDWAAKQIEELDDKLRPNKFDERNCCWDSDGCVEYFIDDDWWYQYDPISHKWCEEGIEIGIPHKPFVSGVIAWADKHLHERKEYMIEN